MGHNSQIAGEHLRQLIERIERLEEEKAGIGADIREVYAEAKGHGFDPKIMRKIIAIRKKDAADVEEENMLIDVYKAALGMIPGFEEICDEAENAAKNKASKKQKAS
ncbi:MAG: DUF2312 domain-containing protein [Candidatus Saccharibacteria bacterium]|nr:DUF2312 domain-containing protein [Candidatus Saccharibacteria bacterium]